MFNQTETAMIIERQKAEIDRLSNDNLSLRDKVEALSKSVLVTGLTTEELQGIHGLIQSQIKLIADLQTGNDTHEIVSAVSSLVDLASLVSKPIER
jgi:hypothetical protein